MQPHFYIFMGGKPDPGTEKMKAVKIRYFYIWLY